MLLSHTVPATTCRSCVENSYLEWSDLRMIVIGRLIISTFIIGNLLTLLLVHMYCRGKWTTGLGEGRSGTLSRGFALQSGRRLARLGGMKLISGLIHGDPYGVMKLFLWNVIRDAVTYTKDVDRKTISPAPFQSLADRDCAHYLMCRFRESIEESNKYDVATSLPKFSRFLI